MTINVLLKFAQLHDNWVQFSRAHIGARSIAPLGANDSCVRRSNAPRSVFSRVVTAAFVSLALLVGSLAAAETPMVVSNSTPVLELSPRLGMPFADNAIFQQLKPIPVWGWSLPGAAVTVAFDSQKKSATAGADGRWQVTLDALLADKLASVNDAPAGRTLTITTQFGGKSASTSVTNILIGEVWLCSGQSNMGGPLRMNPYPPGTIEQANFPTMRKLEDGAWVICTPATAGKFFRVAFCFARELQSKILVPVGLLPAAVGGTSIESWTVVPPPTNQMHPRYRHYESKIAPLAGFALCGCLWYQGEGNEKDGRKYFPKMKALVEGWREVWQQGDFPFYFVQIASIGASPTNQPAGGDGRAEIRNAQLQALALPNTGMAVTIDIGAVKEHPLNKYDVGLRLARWALHRDYGFKDLVPSGPLYKSIAIEGRTIRVKFDYAQNGLMLAKKDGYLPPVPTPDAPMPWLSVQAKDGTWHWADGKIDGADLLVSAKDVSEPVAVRYAYTQYPVGCNLYNKDGLPASPFSSNGY